MINCSQLLSSTCPVHENQVKVKVSIKRSVLYLDEDIVMILTAAIFVATTVASDTIFVISWPSSNINWALWPKTGKKKYWERKKMQLDKASIILSHVKNYKAQDDSCKTHLISLLLSNDKIPKYTNHISRDFPKIYKTLFWTFITNHWKGC